MSSSKKTDLLRDFAGGVYQIYRLEIQPVMLIFLKQLYELLPLEPSLWTTLPPSCVNKYTVHTYTVCKGGGAMGFCASDRYTPAAKSLYIQFFIWRHFALPSMSLIFLQYAVCFLLHPVHAYSVNIKKIIHDI